VTDQDAYDGLNPSDNPQGDTARPDEVVGEVVAPTAERALYARLVVWSDGDHDLFSFDGGDRGSNLSRVTAWNREGNSGRAYLIRVPLPERVK